ncbi:MAG: hypothetical protein ABI539_02075, partial [Acidobacteriota bacterium]
MHDKIGFVIEINVTADELVRILLAAPEVSRVCILDSAGVGIPGSNRLIAGVWPVDTYEVCDEDPRQILSVLDVAERNRLPCIFTLGYDLGKRFEPQLNASISSSEPYVFLAIFDTLIVHDYDTARTFVTGPKDKTEAFIGLCDGPKFEPGEFGNTTYGSDHTREDYMAAVDRIKEFIAWGDTYQTNLTQQISSHLSNGMPPE